MIGPESLIRQAIRERRAVEFRYRGEHRMIEPYRLGVGGGRARVVGWQARKGWRSFHLDAMEEVALTDRHWEEPREGYARGDATMDRIWAEV